MTETQLKHVERVVLVLWFVGSPLPVVVYVVGRWLVHLFMAGR